MGTSPYKKEYLDKKRNDFIKLVGVGVIVVLILVAVLKVVSKKPSVEEAKYIGKIVQIKGDIQDVGLVLRYKESKYIEIKSEESNFNRIAFYRFGEKYSLIVLADSIEEYNLIKKTSEGKVEEAGSPQANSSTEEVAVERNSNQEQIPQNNPEVIQDYSQTQQTTSQNTIPEEDPEKIKQIALKELEQEMIELAKKADEIDVEWVSYRAGCLKSLPIRDRLWAYMPWPVFCNDKSLSPACQTFCYKIANLSGLLYSRLNKAILIADKKGVSSWDIKDLRKKYRL